MEDVNNDKEDIPGTSVASPNLQDESQASQAVNKIPNEVWVLILSQLNQKELIQARTVCKRWREVVDSHFEFAVIIHDGKTNLDRIYELRIRDGLITRLLGDKDIFQFPSLLRRLRFWGPINVHCFQRIMNEAVALEEFSLTRFALMQDNLMGERRLNGFSKIKKLELLGYMCKDESKVIEKNATAIFSYDMPDLEKLTLNFHCEISSINQIAISFMEFISRHKRLHNLSASLVPEANHPNEVAASRITSMVLPATVEESLRHVQLTVLRITTVTKDLPIWTALLNAQTRLQDFRMNLSEGGLLTVNTNYAIGIPFELLREPLLRNASTLTSVELKDLRLSSTQAAAPADFTPADASVFRYATNLKKLILYRNTDDFRRFPQYPDQPSFINLKMLPTSIEVLEISRFYCRSEDLQFLVDVLENLKTIVLSHTGNLNRLGVHGGIVESIAAKTEIKTMNLTPLNYYCSIENKKYDAVKAKFQMNDGDHLYYDFERFRKGLPQPRPPTRESVYVLRSFSDDIFRRSCRRRPDHPFHSRRPCSSSRYREELRLRRERESMLDELFHDDFFGRRAGCRVLDSLENVQCPSESHLSSLFHSLDLHISKEQRMLHLCQPPRQTTRQRRWSGDGPGSERKLMDASF